MRAVDADPQTGNKSSAIGEYIIIVSNHRGDMLLLCRVAHLLSSLSKRMDSFVLE